MYSNEIKEQLKSYEGYINDIPLVIDPCKQCKVFKENKGYEFEHKEINGGTITTSQGRCKECCWFYDSKLEIGIDDNSCATCRHKEKMLTDKKPCKDCDELIETWESKVFEPLTNVKYNDKTGFMFRPEIWVKSKAYGVDNLITAFDNNNESIGGSCVFLQDCWFDMNELFNCFTFLDGSECGKLEE